jgi:hypothetical protein
MTEYEYLLYKWNLAKPSIEVQGDLKEMGRLGWHVVGVIDRTIILEREQHPTAHLGDSA